MQPIEEAEPEEEAESKSDSTKETAWSSHSNDSEWALEKCM